MSTHSASSLEPELVAKKTKKPKDKTKKARKAAKAADIEVDDIEVEGSAEVNWAYYKPPPGSVLLKHDADNGDFDWDAVNNDDNLEIWVMRVPEGIKPKHLKDLKLENSLPSKTNRVGLLERKQASYDVWSLGSDHPEQVGGEETKGLSCLLPRKRKNGKLQTASKPISRHLVVSARPTQPSSSTEGHDNGASSSEPVYRNPPRPRHPQSALKHRFMPVGSVAQTEQSTDTIDVDEEPPQGTDGARKKRKTAGDAPPSPEKAA